MNTKKTDKPVDAIYAGNNNGPSKEALGGAPLADDGAKLKTEATPKAAKAGLTLDELTLLRAKALELNIVVDEDWDEARLRGEIQQAREGRADLQVKGVIPPKEMSDPDYDLATKADKETIEVLLERDYWHGPDDRKKAGTRVRVSRDKAQELVGSGVASRTDPLR